MQNFSGVISVIKSDAIMRYQGIQIHLKPHVTSPLPDGLVPYMNY